MHQLRRLVAPALGIVLLGVAACGTSRGSEIDPAQVDSVELPELGACRVLTPEDVAQPSNATRTVPCAEHHTAETYAVGRLPARFEEAAYDSEELGVVAYQTCSERFVKFLGGDESLVMRSIISWAWFRPSEKAWEQGARWYRCDVVGGGEQSASYVALPETAEDLLFGGRPEDRWMVCVNGATVAGSDKIPCSEPHTWRAVTTVKVGGDDEPYIGDRLVEARSRDYCSDSVGAWLNYPVDYDYGYTWFQEGAWAAGNRRSVCWARTDE